VTLNMNIRQPMLRGRRLTYWMRQLLLVVNVEHFAYVNVNISP
jgi:hypothetical protein